MISLLLTSRSCLITQNPIYRFGKERIAVGLLPYTPSSEREAKSIPQTKFPLHLSLLFAKSYHHLVDEIKAITKTIPKEQLRERKQVNLYGGITMNLYLKDIDSLRPLLPFLKEKDLWSVKVGIPDEKVFAYQLLDQARAITAKERVMEVG